MLKNMGKIWVVVLLLVTFLIVQIIALSKGLNYGQDDVVSDELNGEISFVSNRTDKSNELNQLIEEFEKIHPNVHINLELIGDVEEILERKAAVGDLPDVTLIPATIEKKEFSKYFLPIDDLGFNEDNVYNYISGVGSDNLLYSINTSTVWNGVIYNKQIFRKLEINELPKTEKEFFDVCRKIKDNNIVPVALNYRQSWVMNMWIDTVPYLYNDNMDYNLISESKDVLSKDGEIYKALNFAKNIYNYGYCENDILNYDWSQCKEDIINGNTAMIIWNSDFINQLVDLGMDKNDLGMFPIPETNVIKMNGDYRMGISKNTKYPDVAKEFFKFLFENNRYADSVNIMSSLKGNEDTEKMISDLNEFNIPIVFEKDITSQNSEKTALNEKYNYLRKSVGLDYKFIQSYIISNDTRSIEKDMNDKWRISEKK